MKTLFIPIITAALLTGARAADKAVAAADAGLPKAMDPNVANSLLQSPPFTRSLNLSDSLVLTGIAYIQGKPVATILDKATKNTYVVSGVPNAQGWKLAETNASTSLKRAQAKIMVGSEIVTVRYGEGQLTPDDKKNKPGADGGGPPRREYQRTPEDEERRRRYEALSDTAKEKVRSFFRDNREKLMNASQEERMQFMKTNFERIEKEDQGGK